MNTEVKKRWVEALRSGRYEQTKEILCKDNRFCPLGILCELLKDEVSLIIEEKEDYGNHIRLYNGSQSYLPASVMQYVELEDEDPVLVYGGTSKNITYLNDTIELPFDKIADLIEEQL